MALMISQLRQHGINLSTEFQSLFAQKSWSCETRPAFLSRFILMLKNSDSQCPLGDLEESGGQGANWLAFRQSIGMKQLTGLR